MDSLLYQSHRTKRGGSHVAFKLRNFNKELPTNLKIRYLDQCRLGGISENHSLWEKASTELCINATPPHKLVATKSMASHQSSLQRETYLKRINPSTKCLH